MSRTLQDQIVAGAIKIISDEKHWCQRREARTSWGFPASPYNLRARRFCAYGAMQNVAFTLTGDVRTAGKLVHGIQVDLVKSMGKSIMNVNDRDGREAVIELLRAYAPA